MRASAAAPGDATRAPAPARRSRCVTGAGAVRVDGAGQLRVGDDVRDQADEIVALDPRHPLPAAADRAAEAELERRQQVGSASRPRCRAPARCAGAPRGCPVAPPSWPRAPRPRRRDGRSSACRRRTRSASSSCQLPYQPIAEPLISTAGRRSSRADQARRPRASCAAARRESGGASAASTGRWRSARRRN